jgi:hypothetical protein
LPQQTHIELSLFPELNNAALRRCSHSALLSP